MMRVVKSRARVLLLYLETLIDALALHLLLIMRSLNFRNVVLTELMRNDS